MAMQAQADLTKANAIEFGVRDEPWIKYKLEDGTLLFGRLVIPKIFRADEYDPSGQPIYARSSQNLFTTICPRPLRGTPTNPPPTSIDPSTTNTTSVDFERVGPERRNVYEPSDGTVLRAKLGSHRYTSDGQVWTRWRRTLHCQQSAYHPSQGPRDARQETEDNAEGN